MGVTLINVFNVAQDSLDDFLTNWHRTTGVFRAKPGFVEAHLHRNTGIGNQTFQFINIGRWESAEAWREAHDDYRPTEYDVPGVKGHPAIFETIVNVYADHLPEAERVEHWIGSQGTVQKLGD